MKLLSIGAFVLFVACAASLFSGGQATVLLHHTWRRAADVLPEREINELAVVIPACRARVFELFPPTLREKVAAKTWTAVELITLRLLLALYLAPTFIIASGIGFLEGSWARSNQQSLVKIHSPMRFSLCLDRGGLVSCGDFTVGNCAPHGAGNHPDFVCVHVGSFQCSQPSCPLTNAVLAGRNPRSRLTKFDRDEGSHHMSDRSQNITLVTIDGEFTIGVWMRMSIRFSDRLASLDAKTGEFLRTLGCLGGYCTADQARRLDLANSPTRVLERLKRLEDHRFLRLVITYPLVYQVTKSLRSLGSHGQYLRTVLGDTRCRVSDIVPLPLASVPRSDSLLPCAGSMRESQDEASVDPAGTSIARRA